MGLIYVTGIAGSGKSEVYKELKARGFEVYGTDEDQLAGFYDNQTGVRLENPPEKADDRTPEWRTRYTWEIPRHTIEELALQASKKTVYLCGVSANEEEFLDLFSQLFALIIDEQTIRRRIAARTTNNFGKSEHELKLILAWLVGSERYYRKYPYKMIDATQSLKQVVDNILSQTQSYDLDSPLV